MDTVPDKESTPLVVPGHAVTEFEQVDERLAAVTVLFGSVFGVSGGCLEWCTESIPPAESERLAWLWLCWPHLDEQIMPGARGDHRELMLAYRAGAMRGWYSQLGGSAAG